MKRVTKLISMILTLAIFMTIFSGLAVSVSAVSNNWQVYKVHSYYEDGRDYHVVFSYMEKNKPWPFRKQTYISKMKIDTYVTSAPNTEYIGKYWKREYVTTIESTYTLEQRSIFKYDSCLKFLKNNYRDIYNAYLNLLAQEESYRIAYMCIQDNVGPMTFLNRSQWCQYTTEKYIKKYRDKVLGGFAGTLDDYLKNTLFGELSSPLALYSDVCSIKDDVDELEELYVEAIDELLKGTIATIDYAFEWANYTLNDVPTRYGNGAPLVTNLIACLDKYGADNAPDEHQYSWSDKMGAKLADGIYTNTEHKLTCNDENCICKTVD